MPFFARYRRFPLQRRWIREIVHFGQSSHVVGGNCVINVAAASKARAACAARISWAAIMVRAFGVASHTWPQMRQCYLPFPWPHFYEHPHCNATIVTERHWRGGRAAFFDQIIATERLTLVEIERALRALRNEPVESVGGYRRLIRFARLPTPLLRLVCHLIFRWSGRMRSRYFGTYSINRIPASRSTVMQSTTPITVNVYFGSVNQAKDMMIQILVDHRVVDGIDIGRIAASVETIVNTQIVAELGCIEPGVSLS